MRTVVTIWLDRADVAPAPKPSRVVQIFGMFLAFVRGYFPHKVKALPASIPTRLQCPACLGEEVIKPLLGGAYRECTICGGKGYVAGKPKSRSR